MSIALSPLPTTLPLLFAGIVLLQLSVFAHEPGLSSAMVTVDNDRAQVILTFSSDEIDTMILSPGAGPLEKMEDIADSIMTVSGRAPSRARRDLTNVGDVVFHLEYSGLPQGALTIEAPLLASFLPGHRQYLIVRDGRKHLLLRCYLTPDETSVVVEKSPD